MPRQNLFILVIAATLSIACYHRAAKNRYAGTIADAMGQVAERFVEPVDRRDLFESAMNGMVQKLDPYSGYISPDAYVRLLETIEQAFGGVGMIVDIDPDEKRPVIMSPRPGSPAQEAGLQTGDFILQINGKETLNMSASQTVELIRGDPGTFVTLRIGRQDEDPFDVELKRANIPVESVMGYQRGADGLWDHEIPGHPGIVYVWIESFGDLTANELAKVLDQQLPTAKGFIFDVRENAGGLLDAAVLVCDMFVQEGPIVSIRGRKPQDERVFTARRETLVPADIPIVVLADNYSASAAEIFSACLQDKDRAVVIGQRTWGKGTVQNVIELEGGRSALRLTTATYWRPSGHNIHRLPDSKDEDEWGVRPDDGFEVKLSEDEFTQMLQARRDRFAPSLNSDNKGVGDEEPALDAQLQRAVDYLESEVASTKKKAA